MKAAIVRCLRCRGIVNIDPDSMDGYGAAQAPCKCDPTPLPCGQQPQLGWICGRCLQSNAPHVQWCNCKGGK